MSGSTSKNKQESQIQVRPILPKKEEFNCSLCNKEFSGQFELSRHQKEVHQHLIKSTVDNETKRNEYVCDVCNKICLSRTYLLSHKLVVHKISSNIKIQKEKNFKCHLCSKQYTTSGNVTRHIQREHNIINRVNNFKCSVCENAFPTREKFLDHVKSVHDIVINIEKLNVNSREDFDKWKGETETQAFSRFIGRKGYKSASGIQTKNYICHRNGKYNNESTGKRHSKLCGTNKISSFCPASIVIKSDSSTNLFPASVEYCSTHLGHVCEVERIPLAKKEKDELASLLLSGMPMQHVLHKISEHANPTKRLAVTNIQDLRNIYKRHGLINQGKRNADDVSSVDSWVQQMIASDPNPILLYKLPGKVNEAFPELEMDDFALGFMNEAQEELFKIYGNDVVSIDSTHGTNEFNIQLTSIFVRDDNCQGFPVAFLWSNRQTEELFKYSFTAIKNRTGELHTKTFISDDNPAFYNAWSLIFGHTSFNLLSDWHVKRALAKNLETGTNCIKDVEKRLKVSDYLHQMIEETDEILFKSVLQNFLEFLSDDPDTKNFLDYFLSSYVHRPEKWAACYRIDANVSTNMTDDRWHRELEYNSDLQGKCEGRLDKAIHSLITSFRVKSLGKVVTLTRGILSKKLVSLQKSHKVACNHLDTQIFEGEIPDTWIVPPFENSGETHIVKLLQLPVSHNCTLICRDCDACLHKYSCSCPASAVKHNFCKHAHFVCQKLRTSATIEQLNEDNLENLHFDMQSVENQHKNNFILKQLQKNSSKNYKVEAENALYSLLAQLKEFTSQEQYVEVIKTITELSNKCKAMEKTKRRVLPIQNHAAK